MTRRLVYAVALATMAGCTPTPEKVCDHAAGLSTHVAQRECVEEARHVSATAPADFKLYGACTLAAKNETSFESCRDELDDKLGKALDIVVTTDTITVNGKPIPAAPTLKDFEPLLGIPRRPEARVGDTKREPNWLRFGVEPSPRQGSDRVEHFGVYFASRFGGRPFVGRFSFKGRQLNSETAMTSFPKHQMPTLDSVTSKWSDNVDPQLLVRGQEVQFHAGADPKKLGAVFLRLVPRSPE